MVGQGENLGRAAVVGLDADLARAGKSLGERQHVFEIRAAPGIDALILVADGAPVRLAAHLRRLEASCAAVGLQVAHVVYDQDRACQQPHWHSARKRLPRKRLHLHEV